MEDREFATDVVRRLREAGFDALFAGGCVRDELLGRTPADYDVASSARPEEVVKLFRRTIEVGAAFGVVEVIGRRRDDGSFPKVQVATFRFDGTYTDGRRPDAVVFSSAEEDAKRRDFTINGMFLDPLDGRIIDHIGGQADLQARVLRAIGDPRERFREDKLRLLRAVRMAARFQFAIDPATAAAIREMAGEITVVSAERIAEELRKILADRHRAAALREMADLGLLRTILPDAMTTFDHLAALPDGNFPLAFAALLVDAGKSAATKSGRRLKLSNDEIDRIAWLVERREALADAPAMPPSRLYPLLTHPGIADLLALHRARGIDVSHCDRILRDTPPEVLNPPPLITGDDLIALGWAQGPIFKKVLTSVRSAQLDGEVRTKEIATALALRMRLV